MFVWHMIFHPFNFNLFIFEVRFLWLAYGWQVYIFYPLWQSLCMMDVFRTYVFSVMTDKLELISAILLFVFHVSVLIFLPSCGLLECFFGICFTLIYLWCFLGVVLGVTLYVHNLTVYLVCTLGFLWHTV